MRVPALSRCHRFTPLLFAAGAGLLLGCANGGAPPPPPESKAAAAPSEVKLAVVKHKQFVEELKKQRGKVVVVDVWGEF